MATYHVRTNKEGEIIAGTLSKTEKWTNSTVVTEEALAAVRDHLITMSQKESKAMAYAWEYTNGKTLLLKLEELDTDTVKNE